MIFLSWETDAINRGKTCLSAVGDSQDHCDSLVDTGFDLLQGKEQLEDCTKGLSFKESWHFAFYVLLIKLGEESTLPVSQ